jgi:hypothetical protein
MTTTAKFRVTLIGIALAIFGVAAQRPTTEVNLGMAPEAYWAMKNGWRGCADLVIAGDSRSYKSLSPAILRERLGPLRALNYGFAGNGYTAEYLRAVGELLAPNAPRKVIVLAINPGSLTRSACANNGFLDARKPQPTRNSAVDQLAARLHRFAAVRLKGVPSLFVKDSRLSRTFYNHFHADGWVGADSRPEMPEEALPIIRESLHDNPATPEAIGRVLEATRSWSANGIRVIGFRPPTNLETERVEDQLAKFDEDEFRLAFERAGGRWVTVAREGYLTYDGSHLREEAALRFSRDFAPLLAEAIERP